MPAKVIHRVEYRNVCSQRCERPKQKCLLPITFDAKRPHRSVAMIIVLDKSGSMGGPDFAFTKEAARAPLQLLADPDRFGVVTFDSEFKLSVYFSSPLN